jgi:hypothetical protein
MNLQAHWRIVGVYAMDEAGLECFLGELIEMDSYGWYLEIFLGAQTHS